MTGQASGREGTRPAGGAHKRGDTGGRERNVDSAPGQPGLTTTSGYHQVIRRSAAVVAPRPDAVGAVTGSKNAAVGVPSPPDGPDVPPLPPPAGPDNGMVRRGPAGAGL